MRKTDSPPLTAVIPQEQMGLGPCGVEWEAEPGPHPLPLAPSPSTSQPYPPGCWHEGTPAPGLWVRQGGGPEGVVSWWAVRPWRSHTACMSSGHECVPTRCGLGPRTLQAGRQAPVSPGSNLRGPFNHEWWMSVWADQTFPCVYPPQVPGSRQAGSFLLGLNTHHRRHQVWLPSLDPPQERTTQR